MMLAANRIVAGEGVTIVALASQWMTVPGLAAIAAGLLLGLPHAWPRLRLAGAVLGLSGLLWLLMQGGSALLEGAGEYARVSPAVGFWCLLLVLMLLMADALAHLAPGPLARGGLLLAVVAAVGMILWSGALSELSILQEYASRRPAFNRAALRHLQLAFGSLATAAAIGFPLGILCHRKAKLRGAILPVPRPLPRRAE